MNNLTKDATALIVGEIDVTDVPSCNAKRPPNLRSSLANLHVDTGTVFQPKAVRSFVSRKSLSIEAELESFLVEALTFGKDSEHNSKCASVS